MEAVGQAIFDSRLKGSGRVTSPIKFDNLELYGYPTDHTENGWKQNGEDLKELAALFAFVGLEYCPPEYAHINNWPIIGPFFADMDARDNALYHHLVEFCQTEGKDILVVDPAYKALFIALRYSDIPLKYPSQIRDVTLGAALGIGLLSGNPPIARRTLLHIGLLTTITGLTAGPRAVNELAHWKPDWEDPLRESSSTRQLTLLGQTLKERKKALMVTTAKHWEGIVKNAQNPDLCAQTLAQFDRLREIPSFDSFFRTRYYPKGIVST